MNTFINLNIKKKDQKKQEAMLQNICGEKRVYVNNSESRVIKESKNNHIAMHENNVM